MEYRYKLEIELDEDKIRADGEYTVEQLKQYIINECAELDITTIVEQEGTMIIIYNGDNSIFWGRFGIIETDLYYETTWFRKYAKKMYWYNHDRGADYCEDSLQGFYEDDLKYGD